MISKNIFKTIKPFMVKHQPEILMGMGIAGMIFSTVSAVKATRKAERILLDRELLDPHTKLTKIDTIKLTWKYYIPTAISMAISVPCIVAGNRISNTRNMALAAAYTISETALQEYQDKTKEIVGDKKYEAIQESISSDKIQKTYPDGIQNITMIGDGNSLFFEPLSGRYFKTNWNRISKAANELNASALGDISGTITLNEWFYILGLEGTVLGNELGWTVMDGKDGIIDISIDSVLTPENQPCGSIRYNTMPKKIY